MSSMNIAVFPWFIKSQNRLFIIVWKCKGITSRVLLSKSGELVSTRSSISVCIAFPLFLTSSVCVMRCNAFYLLLGLL